jgi:hypothetical protein
MIFVGLGVSSPIMCVLGGLCGCALLISNKKKEKKIDFLASFLDILPLLEISWMLCGYTFAICTIFKQLITI